MNHKTFMHDLAREAGTIMLKHFRKTKNKYKADNSIATNGKLHEAFLKVLQ